jgi:protein tyrosine/serine phosphatase
MVSPFSSIENFRDFGGFRGHDGVVRRRALFRSGHLADARDDDLRKLSSLGIETIIDLRRPTERARQPSRIPMDYSGAIVTDDGGDRAEAPHMEFLRQADRSDAAVDQFLLEYYRGAPFDPRHLALYPRAFSALKSGAILIHCTAGKDRTGVLAALIQMALGAHRDDVLAQFLETNTAMRTPANIERVTIMARQLLHAEPTAAILDAMLGVRARDLEAALNALEHEPGGVSAYLGRLGVDQEWRAATEWLFSGAETSESCAPLN